MKRVLSFVLTLSILFSLIVPGVSAEGGQVNGSQHTDHSACACAITGAVCDSHTGSQATVLQWTAWGDNPGEDTTLPKTAGNYYLTKRIELSSSVNSIGTGVNICLNGFDITMKSGATLNYGMIRIGDNATVTIMNCKAVVTDGKLAKDNAGIKGARATAENKPGAFWVNGAANFTLLGVEISDNVTTGASSGGWAAGGIMIANNNAIYTTPPHLQINYCRIEGNRASGSSGGAISLRNGSATISNTVFSGNSAKTKGSAVWVSNVASALTLTDCEFIDNTVTDSNASGAIDISNSGAKLTVRGNTIIENNIAKDKQGDIFLTANAKLTVGALAEGAKLNVATANTLNATTDFLQTEMDGNNNVLTNGKGVIVYANRLVAGNKTHLATYANGSFAFADNTHSHAACACAIAGAVCADHTTAAAATEWTAWANPTALPTTTAGNYYLTCDVVLSATHKIPTGTNICLNGYDVRYSGTGTLSQGLLRVSDNASVMVMNCRAKIVDGKLAENSAGFKGGVASNTCGAALHVNSGGRFTLLGVEVSGNSASNSRADGWVSGGLMTAGNAGNPTTVTVAYSRFADNRSTGSGAGAISQRDGTMRIYNTVFDDNKAATYGGALRMSGDAKNLTLENCTFTNNEAQFGGAICVEAADTVTITNCELKNNKAYGNAGGGALYAGAGTITINGTNGGATNFTGNEATYIGGAIVVPNGANTVLTMTGGTINGNKITRLDRTGTLLGDVADGGAGIYVSGGNVTLNAVTMEQNTSNGKHGTAITADKGNVALNSCTVKNNTNTVQSTYRGGIVLLNGNGNLTVSGATVVDGNMNNGKESNLYLRETAAKLTVGKLTDGASVYVGAYREGPQSDPNNFLLASTDANNATPAIDPRSQGWIVYETSNQRVGYTAETGKFYFSVNVDSDHWHPDCACAITGATCENHTAEDQPYEAWTSTTTLPDKAGHFYLTGDVTISQTQVLKNGTVLCLNGHSIKQADVRTDAPDANVVTLIRVTDNAKVTILNCKASITDGKLAANSAGIKGGTTKTFSAGAIHLNKGGTLNLLGVELSGNSSDSDNKNGWGAGALMSAGDANNPTTINIAYSRFANNKATATSGGAISLRAGTANIRNTVFAGNEAAANGGAIHMWDSASKLTLTDCEFTGNKAGTAGGQGGALNLAATKADVTITNTVFDGNEALKRGAAIEIPRFTKQDETQNALTLTVTGCEFTGNKVTGSDAYGGAAMYIANGNVKLKNVTMTGNTNTDRHGSAMVIENSTKTTAVRMEDCTVTGNVNAKPAKRGAVVVIGTDCLTLSGKTVISGNTNNGEAANLYLREKTAVVKMDGLKNGSLIYITTGEHNADQYDVAHPVQDPDVFMTKGAQDSWDKSWVLYENSNMAVAYSEAEKFFFVKPADHAHCLCGDGKDANCKHSSLTWMPWSNSKKLPTVSGNYYLTTNVNVEKSTELKGTTKINLCLNGRAITYKGTNQSMIYNVVDEAVLSISDCTAKVTEKGYSAGKITGATSSAIRIGGKATVNLYDGWIANNTVTSSFGGGIRMVGATTFNMYDGRINRNQTLTSKAKNEKGEEYTVTKHGGGIGADDNGEGTVTVNLYGGEISGNTASASGGGVHIKGGVLNLKGTNIRWNNAGYNGGGISAQMSDLNLEMGNINDNKAVNPKNEAGAETGLGAGVYAVGDNAAKKGKTVKLAGCRIYNNTAWKGGAMLLMYYMDMEYTDGMVTGNKAENNCGGIYVINHSDVTMSGGEIANNSAVSGGGVGVYRAKFTMTGGKIRNNTANENGGGILAQKGSTVVLSGGFLQDNKAINPKNEAGRETGMGGGIYTTGEKTPETDRVTLTLSDNIDIHGNKGNKGGGVMVQNFTTLNIKGGKIYKNNAIHSGAGVFSANNTEMNISGGDIYGNTAPSAAGIATYIAKVTMTGGKVRDNVSSGNAAGILFQKKTDAVLSGGEIYGNRATNEKDAKGNAAGNGGGIYVMGGKSWDDKCTLTLTDDINIHDNKSVKGAGIFLQNFSEMVMSGGTVHSNTATNNGAGVFPANKTKCTITGGTIRNNNAVSGAGITAYQAELNILGGVIAGNTAKEHGSAVLIQKESKVTMGYATITKNTSGKNGAAIHISGTATLNATGAQITENKAGEIGGALYASGEHTDVVLTDCVITDNTAGKDCGGVTIMSHATLETNNCKINNNTSSGMGGGLYIRKGYLTMNGGEVCNNSAAVSGGGMHIEGVDIVMNRQVFVMNGGLISGNSAVKGGGVYLTRDTNSQFNAGVIEKNNADFGGGIYSGTTSLAQIGAIEIKGNTANVQGGGIYLQRGSRTLMTGTSVLDNNAKEGAGGIWVNDDFTMHDLTVKGNSSAKGAGGIHLETADYDGESYVSSIIKMSGNTYIYENSGDANDLYISEGTYVNLPAAGLGQNAKIGVTLQSGLLTRTVIGSYNYEGGDLNYVITCGDRSITDPEALPVQDVQPTDPETPDATEETGKLLIPIIGICAFVLVLAVVAVLIVRKKKKSVIAEES